MFSSGKGCEDGPAWFLGHEFLPFAEKEKESRWMLKRSLGL
jgi:hypothetical protein